MAYKYGGKETIEAELERLALEREAAKARIRERSTLLQQLRRERRRLEKLDHEELVIEQKIQHLTQEPKALPEPIHGGRIGLKRAADEIDDYNRRKKAVA